MTAEHGTRARYNGNRYTDPCRCGPCREANRVYITERRRAAGIEPQKPWRHGTEYAYNHHGCRCDDCSAARSRGIARRVRNARALRERRRNEAA